jgi:protein-disulfide isomerase
MKALIGTGTAALALLLTGCGGSETESASNTATTNAPVPQLTQVEAPNGDWTQVVEQTPEGGFRMGNPNAPVKLVEYASLTCPHCQKFTEEAHARLTGEYVKSGQVSYEFRNFVLNPVDLAATLLARCQAPSAFFASVEQLYAQQREWSGKASEAGAQVQALPREQQPAAFAKAAGLDQFFRQRGMPAQKANSCLTDQQATAALVEANQTATQQGVTGTPTFFINGQKLEDANSWETVEPRIREAIG